MIHVFYRTCYSSPNQRIKGRNRPKWFSKEKCLHSMIGYCDHQNVKFHFVYDGAYGSWKDTFLAKESFVHDKLYFISCGNEADSFLETFDLVMKHPDIKSDDIVYFVEDDYMHHVRWEEALLDGFSLPVDYVTLYDHADKYNQDYVDLELKSQIFVGGMCHWRTIPSTTNTYAARQEMLIRDMLFHRHFSEQPSKMGHSRDREKFEALQDQAKRKLVSPMPSYSTHCEADLLGPLRDWGNYRV